MASTTIIVPGLERAAAYGSARTDGRVRDDLRTAAVSAPSALARDTDTGARSSGFDSSRLPRVAFGEPRGALPFLAQQLAQNETDAPPSTEADVAPALRFSALRAYGVAHESTIEFLSPTQHYDLRV